MATAIARYSDLLTYMAVDLPGNPAQQVMLNALRRSGRDFCESSEAWVQTLSSIDLVADQKDYTLIIPCGATIYRIDEVRINSEDNIALGNDGVVQDTTYYTFSPPDTLSLESAPSADVTDGLEVNVFLVPPLDFEDEFDEWFMERWHEAILDGAMYLMCMQQKKPWSSMPLAAEYKSRFFKAINRAKSERSKKYVEKTSCFGA